VRVSNSVFLNVLDSISNLERIILRIVISLCSQFFKHLSQQFVMAIVAVRWFMLQVEIWIIPIYNFCFVEEKL